AMQDSLLVCAVQGGGGGEYRRAGGLGCQPVGREAIPKGAARQLLHDEKAHAVGLDVVVDGHDVGMIERGENAGLGEEPRLDVWIGPERWRQLLDGDGPAQLAMTALQDDAEASASQLGSDVVGRKRGGEPLPVIAHSANSSSRSPSYPS